MFFGLSPSRCVGACLALACLRCRCDAVCIVFVYCLVLCIVLSLCIVLCTRFRGVRFLFARALPQGASHDYVCVCVHICLCVCVFLCVCARASAPGRTKIGCCASARKRMVSSFFFSTAHSIGVSCKRVLATRLQPPTSTRSRTSSSCPVDAAMCSGVKPRKSAESTTHPAEMSRIATFSRS